MNAQPLLPDLDQAIGFLETLRPKGPWNLVAIAPDGPITSATFVDTDKARDWLTKHAHQSNIYFGANPAPCPSGKSGRANATDIESIEFLHGDFDVDKFEEGHRLFGLSLDERKKAVLDELTLFDQPTLIVDTGGGLQALWRLDEPLPATPENIDWACNANRWLADQLSGGDGNAIDIARILRLPGTINFPDKRKRDRGRVPARARQVMASATVHSREHFGQKGTTSSATLSDRELDVDIIEEADDLEALVARYGLDEETRQIIEHGRVEGRVKQGDDSRSAWLFEGACRMARAGVPAGVVAGVLLNTHWAISGHVYAQQEGSRTHAQYALRQALRARAMVDRERAFDNDVNEDHLVQKAEKGRHGEA